MQPRTVTPSCDDYPEGLSALAPPPQLRVLGPLPPGPALAIVGTRTPSEPARKFARDAARELSESGLSVWSGGAVGVDAAAHEGALDAGRPTVVVLGSGLDSPFPPQNRALFARVVESGGALVSPFDDAAPAARAQFLHRNGVLAAAVDLLLIVECGLVSGAKNAASHARRLHRQVVVAVQPPWSGCGRGCLHELELGATALRDVEHALELTLRAHERRTGRPASPARARAAQLTLPELGCTPAELALLAAVERGAADVDALCAALGEPVSVVSSRVVELVLRGLVERSHQGLRLASRRA